MLGETTDKSARSATASFEKPSVANATGVRGRELPKVATGIQGLDEILLGGLPAGRPTLVCGSAGCGKTLLAMEFLVRGASEFGEPGASSHSRKRNEELAQNVRSLGFDLDALVEQSRSSRSTTSASNASEIEETGEYDLEGLFLRLGMAIDSVGARARRARHDRVAVLRASRTWRSCGPSCGACSAGSRTRGVTAVITGERGDGTLTRQGLEEYVSDCVILLDHRIQKRSRRGGCASSSTAARVTARTSIRS